LFNKISEFKYELFVQSVLKAKNRLMVLLSPVSAILCGTNTQSAASTI